MVSEPIEPQEWVIFPFLFVRTNLYYILGYKPLEGIMPVAEAKKTSKVQKYPRGNTACMKKLDISTKACGQLTPNDTYFAYRWSSSVKTADEAMAVGVNYCGTAKMSHKGFCLATLEKSTKD